jgi:hypothetical protein
VAAPVCAAKAIGRSFEEVLARERAALLELPAHGREYDRSSETLWASIDDFDEEAFHTKIEELVADHAPAHRASLRSNVDARRLDRAARPGGSALQAGARSRSPGRTSAREVIATSSPKLFRSERGR